MPFWSARELGQVHCEDEWQEYKPVGIDIEEFLDDCLTGMHKDGLLIGVNWTQELEGEELEPMDLLQETVREIGTCVRAYISRHGNLSCGLWVWELGGEELESLDLLQEIEQEIGS